MQSFWEKKLRIIFSIIIIILSITFGIVEPVDAGESEEGETLFGASLDLGYVGPNVWAGWQTSLGPCFQPTAKFSIGEFGIGMYMNFYGSEKDRSLKSTGGYVTGKYSKGLFTCDEVQFFADWEHAWGDFSLAVAYWHYSYGWISYTECQWFGRSNSGELTIVPAYQLGPFSIYTEQNMVVIAPTRLDTVEGAEEWVLDRKKTDIGSYHGVFGVSWSQEASDELSIDIGIKMEWATWKFIKPWVGSRKVKEKKPSGIYHITLGTGSSYSPLPWLSISANFNVQFITNKWIRLDNMKVVKGCIPYAGVHTTYSWGW